MLNVTTHRFAPEGLDDVARAALAQMGVSHFEIHGNQLAGVTLKSCTFLTSQISVNAFETTGHEFAVPQLPVYTVDTMLSGRLKKSTSQSVFQVGPSEMSISRPSSIEARIDPVHDDMRAKGISCFIPEDAARRMIQAHGLELTEVPDQVVSAEASDAGRSFQDLMTYVYREFIDRDAERLSNGRARLADALISDHAAELFEDVGIARPLHEPTDGRLANILNAEELLRTRYSEALTIGQIAAQVGMSTRGFQRAFKTFKGVSPSLYRSTIRLEAVRTRLLEGRPDDTVTVAAYEAGIFHLGRMAARYRAIYGETPQETLRKARQSTR